MINLCLLYIIHMTKNLSLGIKNVEFVLNQFILTLPCVPKETENSAARGWPIATTYLWIFIARSKK